MIRLTPPPSPLPVHGEGEEKRLAGGQSVFSIGPLPNYSLSTICPQCNAPTIRRACKVRCERCGFVWDCSEL